MPGKQHSIKGSCLSREASLFFLQPAICGLMSGVIQTGVPTNTPVACHINICSMQARAAVLQIVLIIGIAMCVFGALMLAVAAPLAQRLRRERRWRRPRRPIRCAARSSAPGKGCS